MTDIPKIVQNRLQAAAKTEAHLDPDLLTAFAENSLAGRERAQVLEHLAQCAACRDVVSLALPQVELTHSTRPARSPWLNWPVLRWGALATCVVVVGAAVTLRHERRQETALFVEEKAPTPPAPPAKPTVEGQVPREPTRKLAAKIAPSSPFQSDRGFGAASKLSKEGEAADASSTRAASTRKAIKQLRNDQPADTIKSAAPEPVGQMAEVAPASPPAAKATNVEPPEERNGNLDYSARANNETVTVGSQSVQVAQIAPAVPGKTKDESREKAQNARAEVSGAVALGERKAEAAGTTTETVSREYDKLSRADNKTAPRWTLSPDGALQRSFDSGRTWQTIPVASAVTLRALAANDSNIWVGGAAGALYHSSDAGQHWTQIKLVGGGKPLTADIITVEFTDSRHGKFTTDDRETWTTSDGGESWRRQ